MAQPDPSVTRIAGPWRHHDVHANGIRFQCVEAPSDAGDDTPPTTRPLVILLHGFASFWWSWRHQLAGLSGARVVAVDLRGYGGSDKPPRGYDGWTLAGDTAGLTGGVVDQYRQPRDGRLAGERIAHAAAQWHRCHHRGVSEILLEGGDAESGEHAQRRLGVES